MISPIEIGVNFGAKDMLMSGGVSRSGRILKKSSKLLDFQSPDEVEKKPRRPVKNSTERRGRKRRTPGIEFELSDEVDMDVLPDLNDLAALNASPVDLALDVKLLDEAAGITGDNSDAQMVSNQALLDNLLNSAPDSEDELDNLVADLVEGVEAESLQQSRNNIANNIDSTVRSSLYMTEKNNKRTVLRDGKLVTRKTERKDKGKSRCTAYSLWARDYRKSSKFNNYQDLDIPNTTRRLGELWANVPNKEKNVWRRKAKQQSIKSREFENNSPQSPVTKPTTNSSISDTYNTSFLNRATTSRTKKLAEAAAALAAAAAANKTVNNSDANKRQRAKSGKYGSNRKQQQPQPQQQEKEDNEPEENDEDLPQSVELITFDNEKTMQGNQQSDIKTIDAAAHLKLLGESLAIIGQRLKEHDGQIAMSGSLSVLLDSVLCSLGPLLCLTTHIPGLQNNEHLQQNLSSILDNIAYVMPGL